MLPHSLNVAFRSRQPSGGIGQYVRRTLAPNQKGQRGYEGYLHERVAPLPALFQDAGYRTFMSGKWHLGLEDDQAPTQRGFDKAFALLEGGAGHFPDMQSLWQTEVGNRGKAKYRENGAMLDELPDSFEYSSQFYVDKLIEYLDSATVDERGSLSPFCLPRLYWLRIGYCRHLGSHS